MANKIACKKCKQKRRVSYPWANWFEAASIGNLLVLEERQDYWCMTSSMTRMVRRAATRHKLTVEIEVKRGVRRGRARCDQIHVTIMG